MPDSQFEHNAKQKLDELTFTPSESVWLQVKGQIGKDKRRRRMLIWIPLGCFLLAGGGWFLFSGESVRVSSAINGLSEKKQIVPGASQMPDAAGSSAFPKKTQAPGLSATANQPVPPDKSREAAGITGNAHSKTQPAAAHGQKKDKRSTDEADKLAEHILDMQGSSSTAGNPGVSDQPKDQPVATENDLSGNDRAAHAPATALSDSAERHQQVLAKTAVADSLKKKAAEKPGSAKRQGIQWGIVAGGGFSSFPGRATEDYPYASAPTGVGGNGGIPGAYTQPAEKHASAFSLGLRLQKKLTATTSLFSGLQYSYASVKIASGSLVNQSVAFYNYSLGLTTVNSYYAVVNNRDYNYRNQYHFLEIPLGIEHQFGRRSRLSFSMGVSAAWLFATNALLFNPDSGIYFRHNAYLNRVQWNVLGGLQYRLLRTGNYQLKIGPQFQYGLTGVVNSKMPYTEHRFFGGLQILFSRNEK
jgi:hypothetical protein